MARVNPGSAEAATAKNYFTAFLNGLGLPVTQDNLNALYGVAQLEGWNDRYNPLNVVQPEPGSSSFNSAGVQSYDSFDSGVQGAVTLFSNSHWTGVRAALAQGDNAEGVLRAFKAAYTWDPGVEFPMGQASWGDHSIGSGGASEGNYSVDAYVGGGSGSGGSSTAPPVRMTEASYAGVDSLGNLLKTIPELKKLVDEAVAGNWSTAKFQDQVENSPWYRANSDTARAILIQKANDPAAYRQRVESAYSSLVNLADQLGFAVHPPVLQAIAANALLTGNDSNQQWLTRELGRQVNYSGVTSTAGLEGQMAQTVQQLQQLGASYGDNYWKPNALASAAQQILVGNTTIDTYKQRFMNWAKSAFPALSQEIDAGQTVSDLASPYVQSMSNLLEVDPSTLNVFTPAIRKALQGYTDPATKQREAVPLYQFEDQVRQDPRWAYTQNAKDTMSTALLKIGSDWGFGPNG